MPRSITSGIGGDFLSKRKVTEELLEKGLIKGDIWYIVDVKWFRSFKRYIGLDSNLNEATEIGQEHPGPIDNSSLMKDDDPSEMKENLIEDLDFVLVPKELWDYLVEWFGIVTNQNPLPRKVIEYGRFVQNCKIELHPVRLKLCKDFDLNHIITRKFSRSDSIVHIAEICRELFSVPKEADVKLWSSFAANSYEELKMKSSVLDEALYSDQILVVEVRQPDGTWIRPSKYGQSSDSYVHYGAYNQITESNNGNTETAPLRLPSSSLLIEKVSSQNILVTPSSSRNYFNASDQLIMKNVTPGLCGLANIGNTCFMNSVLQCMSNCPPVTKYFIEDCYLSELNKTNPLGRKGEIASAYGSLIKTMWSGEQACTVPRNFKIQVGKFAPQFSGTNQNDCHELLTFLLDGLHEDLNRIYEKPYFELKDDEGRPEQELAEESWRNHLQRNDSIIIDNFHGLLRSTVVCPKCMKTSVTFDPFCYLSLPLPLKSERHIQVTLFPHDSWKAPKVYKVMVPKSGYIHDLSLALNQLCGVSPGELLFTEVFKKRFRRFFNSHDSLTKIEPKDVIVAYEVPSLEHHINVPVCLWLSNPKQKFDISQFFGHPTILSVPRNSWNLETIYEAVLTKLCRYIINPDEADGVWLLHLSAINVDSEGMSLVRNMMTRIAKRLFTLHVVDSALATVVDSFSEDGSHVPESFADLQLGKQYLAVQWTLEDQEQYFNHPALLSVDTHESMLQVESDKITNLHECLKLYTICERLGADDAWYCPECKKHQRASKRIALWKLPRILIIHLKRFSYTRYCRDKINTLVDFPMDDLDLSSFVKNPEDQPAKYNLIGVCNHYGFLGSGHYTAFALNQPTNQWYTFDDSYVSQMSSHSVVSNSAYVLFYLRCD